MTVEQRITPGGEGSVGGSPRSSDADSGLSDTSPARFVPLKTAFESHVLIDAPARDGWRLQYVSRELAPQVTRIPRSAGLPGRLGRRQLAGGLENRG